MGAAYTDLNFCKGEFRIIIIYLIYLEKFGSVPSGWARRASGIATADLPVGPPAAAERPEPRVPMLTRGRPSEPSCDDRYQLL